MPRLKVLTLLSLATLLAPAFGQSANPARPGTLNYIEGQATMNGQALSAHSIGSAELDKGQTLETENGKAELLLTPGVFLRLDDNSAVKMISPDLTHTEVQLERGRAEVEVDQLHKQNNLVVDEGTSQAQLLKNGLYAFDASSTPGEMRVFDGKAAVSSAEGAQKWIVVKGGHELALNGEPAKAQGFDKKQAEDGLYKWSSLRSEYLGEANANLATEYAGAGGFSPGWFWYPGLAAYTWLPGDGMFLSPFGYGFYSPYYVYGGGLIYGGGGGYGYRGGYGNRGGYVNRGEYGNRGGVDGGISHAAPAPRVSGGFGGGASRGGGGGFAGGGGGSHGGGGGGGRR